MREVIGIVVGGVIVAGGLLFLGVIVRFSIVAPWHARGAARRLRQPDIGGVVAVCGFAPPPELVDLYRTAPFLERNEFQLVDARRTPPARWEIYGFYPLSRGDLREARTAHRVRDGIPIASDGDKGCYVVLPGGAVVLRSPSVPGRERAVAATAAELKSFDAVEPAVD
ncbi:MAG TPA: hypothetical protein VLU43_07105 [Anaeromyxobacteraceae bacterium]|nr:hypothetical protein [Anaeromyxobacteraceae bacterium]